MIYVGIDIARLNHFSSALSSDGEIPLQPFKFSNNADKFQLLVSRPEHLALRNDNLIIGPESTTHYDDSLVRTLLSVAYLL